MAARKTTNNAAPPPAAAAPTPAPPPAAEAVTELGPPPPAELTYIEKLAGDLVSQLGPQLTQQGHGAPVLLWGLAAAAKVVEATLLHELEESKKAAPEQTAQLDAAWVLVLQRREQYEQHAAEQVRAAFAEAVAQTEQKP